MRWPRKSSSEMEKTHFSRLRARPLAARMANNVRRWVQCCSLDLLKTPSSSKKEKTKSKPHLDIVFEPLKGLCCVPETKSHEQKFPQAKRRRYCRFLDVFFSDRNLMVGFLRVQPPKAGEHRGGASCVGVMYNAVERLGGAVLGRKSDGNSSSTFCT
jgi:hypothetical protein